jgi:muconate cycloisomerase
VTPTVTGAAVYLVDIPLRFTIEHALAARRTNRAAFLVLHDGRGATGIGEVHAREYVTGETLDDILSTLGHVVTILTGTPSGEPVKAIRALWAAAGGRPGTAGAMCALDLALLDLWGRTTSVSIASLLGRPYVHRDLPPFSAVYPLARGSKLVALHLFYRTILKMKDVKLKGTGDPAGDAAAAAAIRRAFPYPITLRVDLNGSLRREAAEEYFRRMIDGPAAVRWFEQPFARDDLESAATFQRRLGGDAILCGDESICTLDDLDRAARARAFRAVNVRIAKHGGLVAALDVSDRARSAGLEAQLGCLVGESTVLSYAGLHLASVAGPLRYREGCFGRYLSTWDVIRPSLRFGRGGRVPPSALPAAGLVPEWDLDRLRRAASRVIPLVGPP